jgi:alanine racemase
MWAEIDLNALEHNVRTLVQRASPARLYAVVKANAYGHGALATSKAALLAGASGLAVICVDEGVELRMGGVQAPILVLGFTPATQAQEVVEQDLTPTVHDLDLAQSLSRLATRLNKQQRVHVEVETGLNRHGLLPLDVVAFAERLRGLPGILVEGLFTHFAAAEEGDKTFTRAQHQILLETSAQLPWIPQRHCAASASLMDTPELSVDMVRAGLGIYGYHPAPHCGAGMTLRPILSLKSRIARVMDLEPGATVGYGRFWQAERKSRVALVMCGYADGLQRRLSGRAQALVHGKRVPIVGRIAMDMCVADVSLLEAVRPGDEVVLLGEQGTERVDADELASLAATISWEILAGVTRRVPRVYLRQGQVVHVSTLTRP